MDAKKMKRIEAKLRNMMEVSKESSMNKDLRTHAGSVSIIRRRKGAPDKQIA